MSGRLRDFPHNSPQCGVSLMRSVIGDAHIIAHDNLLSEAR